MVEVLICITNDKQINIHIVNAIRKTVYPEYACTVII